jgi:hypothetical protein
MGDSSLLQQNAFQSDFEKNFLGQPKNNLKTDYTVTPQEDIDSPVVDDQPNQANNNQSTLTGKQIVESNPWWTKFNNFDRQSLRHNKWDEQHIVLKQQLHAQQEKLAQMQTTKMSSLTRDLNNKMKLRNTDDVILITSDREYKKLNIKYVCMLIDSFLNLQDYNVFFNRIFPSIW